MSQSIYAIATMDTKGHEIQYVADRLREVGVAVVTVDVGTQQPAEPTADVNRDQVAACFPGPKGAAAVLECSDRGEAITAMSQSLERFLAAEFQASRVSGVIGIGGSGGTTIVTRAMQALPIGIPKLMVSTMASGNVTAYVDCSDITMMYSVVDVAGINAVSRRVLANAAHAIAGMVTHEIAPTPEKRTAAMTMFGVTTTCVDVVRQRLETHGFDCLVFHATGSGGRAMEKLVESGFIQGVLDITTTEVADEVVGGVLSSGPGRLDAIIAKAVPYVLSLGALDMVNFGTRDSVPEEFRDRHLHVHNDQVTLMRTQPDENRRCAHFIAEKLNRATSAWTLLIPEKGLSALDAAGKAFHDPDADTALFETLESALETNEQRRVLRLPYHINDLQFATALVEEFLTLASG